MQLTQDTYTHTPPDIINISVVILQHCKHIVVQEERGEDTWNAKVLDFMIWVKR